MGTSEPSGKPDEMLGGYLRWTSIPSNGGSYTYCLLVAAFMLQKPDQFSFMQAKPFNPRHCLVLKGPFSLCTTGFNNSLELAASPKFYQKRRLGIHQRDRRRIRSRATHSAALRRSNNAKRSTESYAVFCREERTTTGTIRRDIDSRTSIRTRTKKRTPNVFRRWLRSRRRCSPTNSAEQCTKRVGNGRHGRL